MFLPDFIAAVRKRLDRAYAGKIKDAALELWRELARYSRKERIACWEEYEGRSSTSSECCKAGEALVALPDAESRRTS